LHEENIFAGTAVKTWAYRSNQHNIPLGFYKIMLRFLLFGQIRAATIFVNLSRLDGVTLSVLVI
jgi:hypothetical protein